jgi:L-asparaginase II
MQAAAVPHRNGEARRTVPQALPDLPGAGPVLAVEWRTGHAVLVARDGAVLRAWGEPGFATYWRSAAKPIQAIPFASGALDAFGLGDRELAVACGSHDAEPFHVAAVRRILEASGARVADLLCGVHDPGPLAGPRPPGGWTALHNNCSGKHAAMLAACRHRGWDTASYLQPEHPLQREIREFVGASAGRPAEDVPFGVDGCGLPTFFLPLADLARSFAWLQSGGGAASSRILDAMGRHPEMVGGTGNADSDLGRATKGRIVSKYGALGVVAAVHRDLGQALAVKLSAGTAQPARAVALAIMAESGWLAAGEREALAGHLAPRLSNHAGLEVGRLETRLTGRSR